MFDYPNLANLASSFEWTLSLLSGSIELVRSFLELGFRFSHFDHMEVLWAILFYIIKISFDSSFLLLVFFNRDEGTIKRVHDGHHIIKKNELQIPICFSEHF